MNRLTLKNRNHELRFFRNRLLSAAGVIIFLVVFLISRLVYLQIVESQMYTTLSKQNQLSLIPIDPKRGLIFDRHGVILAENIPVFSLEIIPSKAKSLPRTISELQKLIKISPDDIQAFYRGARQKRPFQPVPLKVKLSEEEVAAFSVNRWRFPGVEVNARLIRYYPEKRVMAQVVGFMGRINTDELSRLNQRNYSATNYIGKAGVEKYYESLLHGTVGYQQVETDASGRVVRVMSETSPVAGDSIYLTIDNGLEIAAEKAFEHVNGAAVVIDPENGEVLALVSSPSFNPNLFVNGISQKNYDRLENSPNRPLYNRAIRGLYAPGSTIKPYYGLEGLESGVVTPNTTIYDPGYFKYGNHTYMNWMHTGFGRVNLEKAITVSDDTYFYNLAVNVGIEKMDMLLNNFGFGQSTNIEMGEELPGLVPSPAWKLKHFGTHWYTGDTINMGIGQGYLLATPLQLAQAVSALSEHGVRYQTHLLSAIQTPDGGVIKQHTISLPPVNMPNADWNFIIHAMQQVIAAPDGTGFRFGQNTPYTVAGKTGTAQVYTVLNGSRYNRQDLPQQYRDNSLFIAFAPVDHPKIAVAIVVEHAETAPIIARKIMDYYLLTEGILNNAAPAVTTTQSTDNHETTD